MRALYSFIFVCLTIPSFLFGNSETRPGFFKGSFDEARNLAREEGKLFMISFYAEWCTPCNWMNETTFADSTVQSLLNENYVSFKVDIDDIEGYKLKEKYELKYLPTILIFNTQSKLLLRIEETLSPVQMIQALKKYNSDENKQVIINPVNRSPQDHQNFEELIESSNEIDNEQAELTGNFDKESNNKSEHELIKENSTLIFLPNSLGSSEELITPDSYESVQEEKTIKDDNSGLNTEMNTSEFNTRSTKEIGKNSIENNTSSIEELNKQNTEETIGEGQINKNENQPANDSTGEIQDTDTNSSNIAESNIENDNLLGNFEYHKKVRPQYKLQIGVFSQFKNTYKLVNELKDIFPEPVIVLNDSKDDKLIYRVFLGEFYTKEEAEDFQRLIKRKYKIESVVK